MMRNVGTIEKTASGKGITVEVVLSEVAQLVYYETKNGQERSNLVIDIADIINLLNDELQQCGVGGFLTTIKNTSDLGPLKIDATESEVMDTEVGQYNDVHADSGDDKVKAKNKAKKN